MRNKKIVENELSIQQREKKPASYKDVTSGITLVALVVTILVHIA